MAVKRKKWTYKVDNKLRGAYGETDLEKRTIKINKHLRAKDRKAKTRAGRGGYSKKESTVINDIMHEITHKEHPRMHEKNVRRKARLRVERMSAKAKKKMYAKFN